MAIGVIFNFPGGTTQQYDEIGRGLNNGQPLRSLSEWPGGGCLSPRGRRDTRQALCG
jgi:hypothetical protein